MARTTNKTRENMNKAAREWMQAKNVIAKFILALCPNMNEDHREHNAAALIAQLANNSPPLLIVSIDSIKIKEDM